MGPLQSDPTRWELQAPACRARHRECLWKDCGCRFRPGCARWFYCSPACREAARTWSQRRAQQKYRASEKGKACRQQQLRRYRERCRQRRDGAEDSVQAHPPTACEGHHHESAGEKIPCDRPGCQNRFSPSARSPLRRFCTPLCRKAFRRAEAIVRRWQDRCASCPWADSVDRLPQPKLRVEYGGFADRIYPQRK